jgi:hypothetical protein
MVHVKRLEKAFEFAESVGICTIFSEKAKGIPSLWDAVDLPERSAGQTNWGRRLKLFGLGRTNCLKCIQMIFTMGRFRAGILL